jgi:hypothetical protein
MHAKSDLGRHAPVELALTVQRRAGEPVARSDPAGLPLPIAQDPAAGDPGSAAGAKASPNIRTDSD